ncbi:uncharacterized protein LAESUDRAFT_733361 [Laetiporus sulphureus 93-53]|uniref:RING-type domain-containing protein n=1 Tax=Laetiporus sulphureus 93-53 TaxID=1314785 RepID=A0A165I918_9APHY|nr:uncharacterized protein LAESUDRAFT_733361 [Laetiporus sulphureus 93-53]KZT12751.1 hypothetical protein LAESUDRAFT_733361 [Laetiporus sulphureus 93-53]
MVPPPSPTPDAVLPLLHCPICHPSRPLSVPLTLRCGHTVCAEHLHGDPLTRCPLPTCSGAPAPTTLAPHPDSGVTLVPPPAHFRHSQREDDAPDLLAHAHVDITVNKLLGLVQRAQAWFEEGDERVPAFEASDTESESEGERVDDPTEGLYYDPPEASSSNTDQPSHSVAGPSTSRPRSPSPTYSPPRPRKRRRRLHPPPPASRRPTDRERERERDPAARFEKELLAELTCEICFALLLQPVTTPCQHTFCASCLHRALDHSSACPLCRTALPDYTYFQEHPCNRVVLAILLKAFPGAYEERRAALEAEERDARLDTPVFVCQLSFPGMPTMLHFFEPRYRLMLRRCLATPNPRFGMIPPPRAAPSAASYAVPRSTASAASASTSTANLPSAAGNPAPVAQSTGNEYGTMLEIRNVQMLPDGRSVVETWGAWRFRIVERGTLDGYVVARVERVDDWEEEEADGGAGEGRSGTGGASDGAGDAVSEGGGRDAEGGGGARGRGIGERSRARTNADLMATCHAFLDELRAGTPWVVHQLNTAYVPMPEDPAAFSFWMGAVSSSPCTSALPANQAGQLLPIDEHEKAKLLPIRSARLRLRLVVHWIEQLQSNWWFSGGCVVC